MEVQFIASYKSMQVHTKNVYFNMNINSKYHIGSVVNNCQIQVIMKINKFIHVKLLPRKNHSLVNMTGKMCPIMYKNGVPFS